MSKLAFAIFACLIGLIWAQVLPISDDEIQELVNEHNRYRAEASPSLQNLKWNEDLAAFARDHVATCVYGHTSNDERANIGGFWAVGENIYEGSPKPTVTAVTDAWGDERNSYHLEDNSCDDVCGHYTQIVWSDTTDVGCAWADCPDGTFVACNYGPAGNLNGAPPFQ